MFAAFLDELDCYNGLELQINIIISVFIVIRPSL